MNNRADEATRRRVVVGGGGFGGRRAVPYLRREHIDVTIGRGGAEKQLGVARSGRDFSFPTEVDAIVQPDQFPNAATKYSLVTGENARPPVVP